MHKYWKFHYDKTTFNEELSKIDPDLVKNVTIYYPHNGEEKDGYMEVPDGTSLEVLVSTFNLDVCEEKDFITNVRQLNRFFNFTKMERR